MEKKNTAFITMLLCAATISANAQSWSLNGNAGTATTNFIGTTDNRNLMFRTNRVERMRITNSGLVGIGTTAPNIGYAVTVNPGSAGNGIIVNDPKNGFLFYGVKSGAGTGLYIQNNSTVNSTAIQGAITGPGYAVYGSVIGGGAESAAVGAYNYGLGFAVQANSASSAAVFASSNNNYGLYAATTNATYSAYFNRSIFVNGSVFTSSDQKLKQNVQDFTSAMDIINQLRPKKYDFRQDGSYKLMKLPQGSHYGLIAQDVEKVLPNIVKETKFETALEASVKSNPEGKNNLQQNTKSENIDFKAVNYMELIPIMIKGMQEMQATINSQQQKIEELEKRNTSSKTEAVSSGSSAEATVNTKATGAYLKQNAPNPFNQNTVINYYIPQTAAKALINITDMNGRTIKTFTLNEKGNGQMMIESGQLTSGTYQYSLIVNGKLVDAKKMVIVK